MKISQVAAVAAAAFGVVFATATQASLSLTLSNDGVTIVVTDGGAGDASPLAGQIAFSGAVGDYVFQVTTTASKPSVGSAAFPEMRINVTNATYAPSGGTIDPTLVVVASDTGFSSASSPLSAVLSANGAAPGSGAVTYSAFADLADTGAQTTQIGPTLSGTGSFNTSGVGAYAADAGYSITLATTVTSSTFGQVSQFDASFVVPEPATIAVWSALGAIGLLAYRRRMA